MVMPQVFADHEVHLAEEKATKDQEEAEMRGTGGTSTADKGATVGLTQDGARLGAHTDDTTRHCEVH